MTPDKKFRWAVKWAYVMNWGEQGLSALVLLVLASLLGPRDFGTVAMAMVYVLFIQMFQDQGLVAALIQRKDLNNEHLNSVFWLTQAVSLVLVAVSVSLSGWWAAVNHLPELQIIIIALSLTIPMEGLTVVQKAYLQRIMDFKSLSLRSNLSVLAGGGAGIAMALLGYGAWALVGQQVVKSLAAVATLWAVSDWRPAFRFRAARVKELLSFSLANFFAKLATFANRQADALLMGLFFGPVTLGLYRLAQRMVDLFITVATRSIQTVSFPQFSKLQNSPEELRRSMLACLRMSGYITLPALAGLAALSTPLLRVLGEKWVPAIPALQVLCAYGILFSFSQFFGPLLQALGRPLQLAILMWGAAGVGVLGIVGAAQGLQGASDETQALVIALVRLGIGALLFVILLVVLSRHCRISFRDLLVSNRAALVTAILVCGAVLALPSMTGALKPWAELALKGIVAGTVGLATLLGLDAELRLSVVSTAARVVPGLALLAERARR